MNVHFVIKLRYLKEIAGNLLRGCFTWVGLSICQHIWVEVCIAGEVCSIACMRTASGFIKYFLGGMLTPAKRTSLLNRKVADLERFLHSWDQIAM